MNYAKKIEEEKIRYFEFYDTTNETIKMLEILPAPVQLVIHNSFITKMLCSAKFAYRQLDLSYNQIPKLDDDTKLCQSSKLEFLQLTYNKIVSIVKDYFRYMERLRELDLTWNSIKTLDLEFYLTVSYLHPTLIKFANNNNLTHIEKLKFEGKRSKIRVSVNAGKTGYNRLPPIQISSEFSEFNYNAILKDINFDFYKLHSGQGRIESSEKRNLNELTFEQEMITNIDWLDSLEISFTNCGFKSLPNLTLIKNLKVVVSKCLVLCIYSLVCILECFIYICELLFANLLIKLNKTHILIKKIFCVLFRSVNINFIIQNRNHHSL